MLPAEGGGELSRGETRKNFMADYHVPTGHMKYGFVNLKNFKRGSAKTDQRNAHELPRLAGGDYV